MMGSESKAGRRVLERLDAAEGWLAKPGSSGELEQAVAELEQACREWPRLMACVTDRAAWESIAAQIRRLEQVAAQGQEITRTMEVLNGSARGYTGEGEPAGAPRTPANLNCRG